MGRYMGCYRDAVIFGRNFCEVIKDGVLEVEGLDMVVYLGGHARFRQARRLTGERDLWETLGFCIFEREHILSRESFYH
jgi:hypothetical protein